MKFLELVGKQKDRTIPLPGTLFIIGRDPLCHLRPHSNLVSRRHCAIACWGERVLVRDLTDSMYDPQTSPYGWHIIKRLK